MIFFLLLSTSFIELTKQSLPPSQTVSAASEKLEKPPLNPKILISKSNNQYKLVLRWTGENPGQDRKILPIENYNEIQATAELISKNFIRKFATEKTIQLGLGMNITYQEMIWAMDGVRSIIPDIVLISPQETDAIINRTEE